MCEYSVTEGGSQNICGTLDGYLERPIYVYLFIDSSSKIILIDKLQCLISTLNLTQAFKLISKHYQSGFGSLVTTHLAHIGQWYLCTTVHGILDTKYNCNYSYVNPLTKSIRSVHPINCTLHEIQSFIPGILGEQLILVKSTCRILAKYKTV